jgi:proline racemase
MLDKRDWAERNASQLRRILMLEPRGHRDMCGAVLTEPVSPGSHAGLLFMDNDGFGVASATGVIAATAIALGRGLLMPGGDGTMVVYDTPAGTIRARLLADAPGEGRAVRVSNVPSFVLAGGLPVSLESLGNRRLRADIAFGGAFYAIVDSEAAGLPIDSSHLADLRRVGTEIVRAIEASRLVEHPLEPRLSGLAGTIFTGPSKDGRADLQSVTVFANAEVDRSPGGTAVAAIMAVLNAMGLLSDAVPFTCEGLLGTSILGRVSGRSVVGDFEAVSAELEGAAWITGEHTFLVADDDPLRDGFLV